MNPNDVVIATPTLYPKGVDEPRFPFAVRMMENAEHAGHPVCVVDSSRDPRVREAFLHQGALVFPFHGPPGNLGAQKRQSVYHATETALRIGASFILMMEPEKFGLIRLIEQWLHPLTLGSADIAIPQRSVGSFRWYPRFQVETEDAVNAAFLEATGLPLDMIMGPVAFRIKTALGYFLNPSGYLGEGVEDTYIQHWGAVAAYGHGLKMVGSPPLDFFYPPEQRRQEEGALNDEMLAKRRWQRDTYIAAYQALARRYELPRE